MIQLNTNSTELTLNSIYLQTAPLIQLTVTKFDQPKLLYACGVKLWADRCTSTSTGFQRLSDVTGSAIA
jgi:hypothetical protein